MKLWFFFQEGSPVDLNALASLLSESICNRDYIERRDSPEDDGLIGLIKLLTAVIKHNPPFKGSPDGCVSNTCSYCPSLFSELI